MKNIVLTGLGVLLGAAALLWLGLRVQPRPLPAYPGQAAAIETVPLPEGLPAPVERFYRAAFGARVPVIHSAVFSGRGTVRFKGVTFPARARFTHLAGQDYRHYIEATVWGRPVLVAEETYLDGHSRLELPVGVVENEPQVDSAANLGLWAETLMMPSVYVTDPRVRWEPVNENMARLIVPGPEGEDMLTVDFDPETGLIRRLDAMRWLNPGDTEKRAWGGETLGWRRVDGLLMPASFAVTWAFEGSPWLVLEFDEVVYNTDVSEYIRARGP